jgi:hypothetical protein
MKSKTFSLAAVSLGLCTLAMAAEYKTPDVGFKETAPSVKVAGATNFDEGYKVEKAALADRQIASEKDSAEREPSSYNHDAKDKDVKADEHEVKPWLYKINHDSAN